MADVFLSFAREDQPTAARLATALEALGWSVWWDHRLLAGQDFRAEIQRKLDEARCIVVLWSNLSVQSGFVINEASEGLEGGRLVPVLLEDVEQPIGFRHVHTVPLFEWRGEDDDQFKRVVASIEAALAGPTTGEPPLKPAGQIARPPALDGWLTRSVGSTPRAWITSFLLLFSPLLVLAADYVWRPVLWSGCTSVSTVSVEGLFARPFLPIGTLLGHQLTIGLDDFNSSRFLADAKGAPQALVTTIYFETPLVAYAGPETRALLTRLESVSAKDHTGFVALLNDPANLRSGAVHAYELEPSDRRAKEFPLDRIYVVAVQYKTGEGGHANDGPMIAAGLKVVLSRTGRERVARLLVPSLGVNWEDPGWLTHADFYRLLFAAVEPSSRPPEIRLSLYENTPRSVLQQAVNAVNDAFGARCATSSVDDVLFHQRLRTILVALFLCLVAASLQVRVTVKTTLIVTASFVALSTAALSSVDQLVADYGTAGTRAIIQSSILAALALSFPIIIRWNPQDVFQRSRRP
jgi:hypothetical protein